MSHTPGPWGWDAMRFGTQMRVQVHRDAYDLALLVDRPAELGGSYEQQKADARLIAAAPEMFEALEHGLLSFETLIRLVESQTGKTVRGGVWVDEARAALAKALGES